MEQLERAKKKLKTAHEKLELDYTKHTREQDEFENKLLERIRILDEKKQAAAAKYGVEDANDNDRVEINAGGKIIAARRGVLCQLKGTKFEAIFSGRWEKKLVKDGSGRIFLDVNGDSFQAIVDYLNELVISGEDDVPKLPLQGAERHMNYLACHLKLFGINPAPLMPDSTIITKRNDFNTIHQWLDEGGVDGGLELIYRSSRDGSSNETFHSKCDNVGPTLVIIETTGGIVLGGYTNTQWRGDKKHKKASKSFLFVISGFGEGSPCKMKLKNEDDSKAVYHGSHVGPSFGARGDFCVTSNCQIFIRMGETYEQCPIEQLNAPLNGDYKQFNIKEMEVFTVSGSCSPIHKKLFSNPAKKSPTADLFGKEIIEAINEKWATLHELEMDILSQEEMFKDEEQFIDSFASGDEKDLVTLDVSGTVMVTKRASLQVIEDSVLAQQFDDTKWTEQGNGNAPKVKEWTPDDVTNWVKQIEGVPDDVAGLFRENAINGLELLALDKDGLKMLGVERVGTICLLLKETKLLEQKSQDVSTLIEHSPYCFGKILDHLRLKRLRSIDLAGEPAPPKVCESQQKRFEKVVKYYFPGESSKIMLSSTNSTVAEARAGGRGREPLRDAILTTVRQLGATNGAGVFVAEIWLYLQSKGYSANPGEVRRVVDDLSNEGVVYSTIDENHIQIAE